MSRRNGYKSRADEAQLSLFGVGNYEEQAAAETNWSVGEEPPTTVAEPPTTVKEARQGDTIEYQGRQWSVMSLEVAIVMTAAGETLDGADKVAVFKSHEEFEEATGYKPIAPRVAEKKYVQPININRDYIDRVTNGRADDFPPSLIDHVTEKLNAIQEKFLSTISEKEFTDLRGHFESIDTTMNALASQLHLIRRGHGSANPARADEIRDRLETLLTAPDGESVVQAGAEMTAGQAQPENEAPAPIVTNSRESLNKPDLEHPEHESRIERPDEGAGLDHSDRSETVKPESGEIPPRTPVEVPKPTKTPTTVAEHLIAINTLRNGELSAVDAKRNVEWLIDNKFMIRADLGSRTIAELKQRFSNYYAKSKSEWVDAGYNSLLHGYLLGIPIRYVPAEETYETGVRRALEQLTDEKIQQYAAARRAKLESRGVSTSTPERPAGNDEPGTPLNDVGHPEESEPRTPVGQVDVAGIRMGVQKHYHTKRMRDVYIVTLSQRVERAEYERLNSAAKRLRGWYSRSFQGSPAGFAFLDEAVAQRFISEQGGGVSKASRDSHDEVVKQERGEASLQTPVESTAENENTAGETALPAAEQTQTPQVRETIGQPDQVASDLLDGSGQDQIQKREEQPAVDAVGDPVPLFADQVLKKEQTEKLPLFADQLRVDVESAPAVTTAGENHELRTIEAGHRTSHGHDAQRGTVRQDQRPDRGTDDGGAGQGRRDTNGVGDDASAGRERTEPELTQKTQTQPNLVDAIDAATEPAAPAETAVEATAGELPPEPTSRPAPPEKTTPISSQPRHRLTDASFTFTPDTIEAIESGGKMTKFRQNVAAIEVMREVLKAGRQPMRAEQEVMALYAGFGGIKEIFNPYQAEYKDRQKWYEAADQLRQLIGDEAFEAADRSVQNAHYTSPRIVQAMWQMAERFGFAGGRVLEPSMGSGNFLGLTPTHLRETTTFTGVELDPTTGEIACLLYPDANIKIQGFEDTPIPDNFYDLALGNVPFGDYRISDPRYNKYHTSVHNYFFLKATDKVRPGGLVMFITSTGTLDAPRAQNVRDALNEKADLVAAMRFPAETFRNALTSVVTDLIILRKRLPGEEPKRNLWTRTEQVPNPDGGEAIQLNSYYATFPEKMLGEFNGRNRMYPGRANLDRTDDFAERFEHAIERLPSGIMTDRATALQAEFKEAGKSLKRGAYVVENGELFRHKDGQLVKVEADAKRVQRIEGMLKIRDVLNGLTDAEMGRTKEDPADLRSQLNTVYDGFTVRYGPISDKANQQALEGDPDLPRLMSLEDYDPKRKHATKRPIFFRATIVPVKLDAKPQNIAEAVVKSLSLRGEIIMPMISGDLSITHEEAAAEMVGKGIAFQTPAGNWELAAKYLSGNVRQKLTEARAAAEDDPFFAANVEALEAVVPPDIPYTAISVQMGAPWIEPADISRFVAELFNDPVDSIKVFYDRPTGAYLVDMNFPARARASQETTTTWGTPEKPFRELLDLALQGRAAKVMKEVPVPGNPRDTRMVLDPEKTQAANTKLDAIKQRFREWVWQDEDRREHLAGRYNEMFNSLRAEEYDASFMADQVPGMSPDWKLRPHQKAAVLRGITERRGLVAHEVGLGKTLAMLATASELKRLGIAAKPAIAVPKKVLPGFTEAARDAFPMMRLHVIDSRDAEKRQRTMSAIATGDFDLVLMTHDNLNMLRMRPEFEASILGKELEEVNAVYEMLRAEQRGGGRGGSQADNRILATIRKRRETLKAKIKDALETKLKDDAITFEDTGIDFLFVDEFHKYKSLPVVTALGQIKGVPTGDSQRAINMLMRTRYLQKLHNNGGIIAATGTPISNSLVEAYIMGKFLQPDVMEDSGVEAFDAWARNFAEVVSALELDATGQWKPVSRLSKFKNLPELQTMSRVTLDVKTAKETGILQERPERKDKVISIPLDPTQKLFMRYLRERADRIKAGMVDPSVDNYFVLSHDGRHMSADIRLVLPGMADRPSAKVQALIDNVIRIHQEKPGTTQMIFCDIGVSTNSWGFRLYGEIMDRLAEAGIPKEKIIDFSKLDSDAKVEKAVARLIAGDAIIAIGHRESMGTGVNAQRKMAAIHQFDTTWKPAMIEQSEARGWRQGNKNAEIEILSYVVEGSFDAVMWATVARKQQGISSFMRGTVTAREMSEEDGEDLTYEQIAAAASGDQDYLRKAELDQRVFKLDMMKQAHDADILNRKQAIPRIEGRIQAMGRAAERCDDQAEWARAIREREVEYISPEGTRYTDKAEAAKLLTLEIARAEKQNKDAPVEAKERIFVGEYKGVRLRVGPHGGVSGVIPPVGRNADSDFFTINPNFENYAGTLQSFDQSLASIAANHEAKRLRESEIPSLEQDLQNLRKIEETPFQHEAELSTAKTQLEQVAKRLEAKERESEAMGEPLVTDSGLDIRMVGQLGRLLRHGCREKEIKLQDVPAILEKELPRIKIETEIAKAEWAEYIRKKTDDYINRYGLEEVAMWEMAKSAARAQRAYGDLYAEQQAQTEGGVLASIDGTETIESGRTETDNPPNSQKIDLAAETDHRSGVVPRGVDEGIAEQVGSTTFEGDRGSELAVINANSDVRIAAYPGFHPSADISQATQNGSGLATLPATVLNGQEGFSGFETVVVEGENNSQDVPRFRFIEDALAAGAEVDYLSIRVDGSGWTVVSFENAPGVYLLKGEDVYVTQSGFLEAEASIKEDPNALPRLGDLDHAGEIEIDVPDIPFSKVLDSMASGNRVILESALNQGASVERFWAGWGELNPTYCHTAIVRFGNDPRTYIFNNDDGTVGATHLDFGATRYAVAFDHDITDRTAIREIHAEIYQESHQVAPRKNDYSVSM